MVLKLNIDMSKLCCTAICPIGSFHSSRPEKDSGGWCLRWTDYPNEGGSSKRGDKVGSRNEQRHCYGFVGTENAHVFQQDTNGLVESMKQSARLSVRIYRQF